MFSLARPSREELERVLAQARTTKPTFDHIGSTRSSDRIAGFRFDRYSETIGHGAADWEAGRGGLRAWAAHRGAGASITPDNAPLTPDETVVVTVGIGPVHVLIPCRVSYVVDEPQQFGFAYVTLPGHPECGEESFMLTRSDDDDVTFTMTSHSHPAELLARLGGPISRLIQRRTNHGYIAGMRVFVERSRPS